MNKFRHAALGAALALCFGVGVASAQDIAGTGTFGSVDLTAGFTPDPHWADIPAGGPIDSAQSIGGRCTGHIAANPDYTLNYVANAGTPLYISAQSESDTTLVVYAPDKLYYCDDDSDQNLNPMVYLPNPPSGRYQIWVGTFSGDGENPTSSIYISEIDTAQNLADRGLLHFDGGFTDSGSTNFGRVTLNRGFTPDPRTVNIIAGGGVDVSTRITRCSGFVSEQADYRVTYNNAGSVPLIFSTSSDADTTLLVRAPNGDMYCDDDSGNAPLAASVNIATPASGDYLVWVGTFSAENSGQNSTLYISEVSSQ